MASRAAIPWKRVLAEGVIIVVSILLALAIDALWSSVQSGRAEVRALQDLQTDFELTRNELDAAVGTIRRRHDRYTEFLNSSPDEMRREDMRLILPDLAASRTFDATTGTLDALTGGGGLDLLTDPALRSALANWSRAVTDLDEHTKDMREAAVRVAHFTEPYGGPFARFEGVPFLDRAYADTVVSMRSDDALVGATRTAHYYSVEYLNQLRPLHEALDSIDALLERNLQGR